MPDPAALRESSWERAKSDAAQVYRSLAFDIGAGLVSLIAVSVSLLFTIGVAHSWGDSYFAATI
jgi:hypothetical protein